jgi:hypothetical protein
MTELAEKIREEMVRVLDEFRTQSVYWAQRDDAGMVEMIEDDINYNQGLLDQFMSDQNYPKLYQGIYHQDTAPREDFYRVLNWIEDHNLA